MVKIIGVRFKYSGKTYYFNPGKHDINKGDYVVVETIRGVELGEVVLPCREVDQKEIVSPLKNIIRIATKEDIKQYENNVKKNKEAYDTCLEKITSRKIDMKLIAVEYTFDGTKLIFYYTADGRIDFRELVKELASVFKTRIEMRQIGVRDETKFSGGLGICGRVFCCHSYIGDFQPVSIKMAKDQGLSLNPTKISGACGRLMCCLKYEQDAYEELIETTPGIGSIVETSAGKGVVKDISLIKGLIKVLVENDNANDLFWTKASEVKIIQTTKVFSSGNWDHQNDSKNKLDEILD